MRHRARRALSIVASAALLALSGAAAAAAPTAPPAPRAASAGQDNWPKKVRMGEFTILLDAPQAESLDGTKLKARGTFRIERAEGAAPASGTVWYEADVQIDRNQRIATLVSVQVPRVQLASAPPARQQRIATRLSMAATRMQWKLSLDDVLAQTRLAGSRDEAPPKLNTAPPRILVESEPAILVLFDGEPRFRAVEGTGLERALNTPFLVLHDPNGNAYYLDGGTVWFRASDPKGPWDKTDKPPSEALQIASRDLKEGGVSASDVDQAKKSADKRVPKILVATEPTELIVSDGSPKWAPEVEGELEGMSNSESDVFRTLSDQAYWVVLSGRWFKSGSLDGPWTYVEPDRLPGSFRRISSDSPRADALSFVPGTEPAREALADATKPRTAAVRRSEAHVTVTYDGDPKFEAVPGTHVEYALNTPDQVLRIRGRYYACDQGVWFTAGSPTGPWAVADSIPEDDIQAIPPESPVYNTRYAYVYDSTPDVVYMAYTPAYLGSYPWYGTVVFGTGWYYRPWSGGFYYPRPWTWGFHARYAPWGGGWGYGFGWGPAWAGFRYGFGFGWGARWCGPGGFFRPAFRNVNITRNVNVTRNVTVNRNLYTSGANASRATATHTVTARTSSTAAARTGTSARSTSTANSRSTQTTARTAQSPRATKASPQARKAKPAGGRAGGHAPKGGGGRRK